jgi:hypothetical protein
MADSYISGQNYTALTTPVLAATVYAAQETSLFLGGALVPIVQAPNGILQVPELAAVTATTITSGITTDVAITNPSQTKNDITTDLYAARAVVRDLGNIDPAEIGRALGKAVATKFDSDVYAALDSATASTTDSVPLSVDDMFDAVAQIRSAGESGQLFGVLSPNQGTVLMKDIGTAAYAGGDFQSEALRTGYIGNIAGVQMFMSSNVGVGDAGKAGYIFGTDAMRIAMQQNVSVEVARRAEAVGVDVVASLMAKPGLVDATRAVRLINV